MLLWPQGTPIRSLPAPAAGNTFFNPAVHAVIPVLTTEDQHVVADIVRFVQLRQSCTLPPLGFLAAPREPRRVVRPDASRWPRRTDA
jgi:hypothetical protein